MPMQPELLKFSRLTEKEFIEAYWTERTDNFSVLRMAELRNEKSGRWLEEITSRLPADKPLRILDVGTGCGFFAIMLASLGHTVSAIDLTPSMIESGKQISGAMDISIDFQVMDAEALSFADESFDAIVSRNLTWTLPNPLLAYGEWLRVLKPEGVLLNFDGAYGYEALSCKEPSTVLPIKHVHNHLSHNLKEQCNEIYRMLDISYLQRPEWDNAALQHLGYRNCTVDRKLSTRIYKEIDELYNPTPMFLIRAFK